MGIRVLRLHCLLLVIFILTTPFISHSAAQSTPSPSPSPSPAPAPAPPLVTGFLQAYFVSVPANRKPSAFPSLSQWHLSLFAAAVGNLSSSQSRFLYSYHLTMQGFSAFLPPQAASKLLHMPVVEFAFPDSTPSKLHTTRTPAFLGLLAPPPRNAPVFATPSPAHLPGSQGKNVIVGLLDSGIWPEHPSFSDAARGFTSPVSPRWEGSCESFPSFPSSLCNHKLIGARAFFRGLEAALGPIDETIESKSPRDADGHGTHTSAIASGRSVPNANLSGAAPGTASGMAPLSHVAMYKVCWYGICLSSDILAGFEAAIKDGVDVISFSIGSAATNVPFYRDAIAIGVFAAVANGIITSCSAGNAGPAHGTTVNVAPWTFSVAASSIDRDFPASVVLGDGSHYNGISFWSTRDKEEPIQLPLISAADAVVPGGNASVAGECLSPELLVPHALEGKIVLCDTSGIFDANKGFTIQKLGGAGMILGSDVDAEGEVVNQIMAYQVLPSTLVGYTEAAGIKQHISSTSNPTAHLQFPGTRVGIKPAPVMGVFSSRGPNPITPQIPKPDVTAPGLNILGAWTGFISPTDIPEDERRVDFNIISGTSMSCPHVAGMTALLKAAYPTWSPAAIRSAIMTTATTIDNTGKPITDAATGAAADPTAHGSGHIHPPAAFDPGLVYDIGTQEYADFLCSLNYTNAQMGVFVGEHKCSKHSMRKPGNLNYPSLSAVYNQNKSSSYEETFTRTLTNVGPANSTYRVSVKRPSQVIVSVKPSKLSFGHGRDKLSYSITFSASKSPEGEAMAFGSVVWSDGFHHVRSPISFSWK